MKNTLSVIVNAQKELEGELIEIFSDLVIDYDLLEKDIKALDNTSYKFYHKEHGLIKIVKVNFGYEGYDLYCKYLMKYEKKTNVYIDFVASISSKSTLTCVSLGRIGTCFAVENIR